MVSPPGSEDVVICTGVGAAVIVMSKFPDALCTGELESFTLTANEELPAAVGMPLICPEPLSVRPAGREPVLTDQV